MRRNHILVLVCVTLLAVDVRFGRPQGADDPYAAHVSRAGPRSPEEERSGFHLPPGFEIQLVAAEPYVRKPININFDERGRLWVTESVEYPFPAATGSRPRDTVRILQNFSANGLAREVTTFADGLNIPIGVLPVMRGAIVYSIPAIQRLIDPSGNDRALETKVLYSGFGHKDTHGMTGEFTRGFDGWIYACHGFSNISEVKGADGHAITMQSGNIYRFKPDGSRVEQITHGQVNPFGLAFDPLGNLYSCDCHSRPIYQLLRGAYYPSFGKPDDGLGFGPEMMTHDHGSTAIAGITYYAADQFPAAYRGTIFVGNVVTNRINHDRLEWHGSSPTAIQQPDFLTSDDPWFRPVDIKLGPDGSLYVADFYNRIIGHYEVPLTHPGRDRIRGRIWRIVYRGPGVAAPRRQASPDWGKATVDELVAGLASPNLMVRVQGTEQLVERGGENGVASVRAVLGSRSSPYQRMHGLWVLERQQKLGEPTVTALASDPEPGVRGHAMRVLAERALLSENLHRVVLDHLRDPDALVRRNAADAVGRHPAVSNIRPLLDLLHGTPADDTHLTHVARMAIRDQFQSAERWKSLPLPGWNEKDARAVADIATGVPTPDAAQFLLGHLEHFSEAYANQVRYVYHVARYGDRTNEGRLLSLARGDRAAPLKHQFELAKAIFEGNQARGSAPIAGLQSWGEELTRRLFASGREADLLLGMELGGLLKVRQTLEYVGALAGDKRASQSVREAALATLASSDPTKCTPVLGGVLADPAEPIAVRIKAAQLLAGLNRPESQAELLKTLIAAPRQLAVAIAAGLSASPRGAEKLLAAVTTGKASPQLVQERQVQLRLGQSQLPGIKERIAELTRGLPSPDKRIADLMAGRRTAYKSARVDASLGAKVFEKHCAICHQLANRGAKIGPQLDGIGVRGLDRVLEDIIDPSRNVDQAFRLTTLGLKNGQIVSGLLLREEGKVLVLADNQGKEVRVAVADVDDRTLSQLSPMPANLVDQIPRADFNHLLAFLLAQQPPRPAGQSQNAPPLGR
jgi:putative heme-binding domain-containing protein